MRTFRRLAPLAYVYFEDEPGRLQHDGAMSRRRLALAV
jgi:hypothetical protein